LYKVIAKRYGDSVEFAVDADDPKIALQTAKSKANDIFGYRTGEAGAPTVSVKPVAEIATEDC
jgi:hypothetical protein